MDNIDVMLKNAFSNKYFSTSVSVVLALYAGALAPALPNKLIEIADTLLGKIIFVFLIGYLSTKNIQLSIMVAVAFAVTLTVVNKNRINEAYSNYNMVKNIERFYGDSENTKEHEHAKHTEGFKYDKEEDEEDEEEETEPFEDKVRESTEEETDMPAEEEDVQEEQFEDYQNSGTEEFLNPNNINNKNVVMPATQYGANMYAPIN
tara:strand:+ start:317 stop:931 length:615 start_codon:yes stop_codon:yes gene_type:complete